MRATSSAKRRELKGAQPRKYIFRTLHCQDYTVQRGSSAKPDARMPHWEPEPRERQGGLTALHIAACAGREEVVEMLLQEGEALCQASQHGCQAKSSHPHALRQAGQISASSPTVLACGPVTWQRILEVVARCSCTSSTWLPRRSKSSWRCPQTSPSAFACFNAWEARRRFWLIRCSVCAIRPGRACTDSHRCRSLRLSHALVACASSRGSFLGVPTSQRAPCNPAAAYQREAGAVGCESAVVSLFWKCTRGLKLLPPGCRHPPGTDDV